MSDDSLRRMLRCAILAGFILCALFSAGIALDNPAVNLFLAIPTKPGIRIGDLVGWLIITDFLYDLSMRRAVRRAKEPA